LRGQPPRESRTPRPAATAFYERRHELPEAFHTIGKHRLAEWVGTLLDREELVMAMVDGSKLVKWLDVPDHENNAPARWNGSFLAGFIYGGRERAARLPSGCKPRFAGFAVCTSRFDGGDDR
jgi:hypothetical protein